MKKITGVHVNPKTNTVREITIEKSLESYYKLLDCTCIDIVHRKIGGEYYDIICDDEALCKANAIPTAFGKDGPMLFNDLFVVKFDGHDDVRSLTPEEASAVLENTTSVRFRSAMRTWQALRNVEY